MTVPSPPLLEAPGKGLPPLELATGRYVLFPVFCATHTNQQAAVLLVETGLAILQQLGQLTPEQKRTQVLIKRIPGLEDSSRYWSPSMVLEHLLITGPSILSIAQGLAAGKTDLPIVRIEDVKPNFEVDENALTREYQAFLNHYTAAIQALPENSSQKHPHPWFGPISLHQWVCLNATHHQIHQKQLDLILKHYP